MSEQKISNCIGTGIFLVILLISCNFANAAHLTPTDLDGISVGDRFVHPGAKILIPDVGTLDMAVFYNPSTDLYTYEIRLIPLLDNATHLMTPMDIDGFNNVAGWSFSEANAAGGPGDSAWVIDWSNNDQLRWDNPAQEGGTSFFDKGEAIRFFYQSTHAPADFNGIYIMGAGDTSRWALGPRPDSVPPTAIASVVPEAESDAAPKKSGGFMSSLMGIFSKTEKDQDNLETIGSMSYSAPPAAEKSEVVKSEVVKSEVVKSEVVKPEVVKPEAVKPEAVKPEVVKPEVVKPEVVKPEVVKPEVVKPAAEKPVAVKHAAVLPPKPQLSLLDLIMGFFGFKSD